MRSLILAAILLAPQLLLGQSVRLAWDLSEDSSVTSYVVRYGRESGVYADSIDAGNQNWATVSGLTIGAVYYFVVHAVNLAGVESLPSNEIFTAVQPKEQVTWYRVQATMIGDFELQQSTNLVNWRTIVIAKDHVDATLLIAGNAAFFRVFPWDGSATVSLDRSN